MAAAKRRPVAAIISSAEDGSIRYVSPQAKALLGACEQLSVGTTYEAFLRGLQPVNEDVAGPDGVLTIDAQKAARKLHHLTSYAKFEFAAVIEGEAPKGIGMFILPTRVGKEGLRAFKLVAKMLENFEDGQYCLTIVMDTTEDYDAKHILNMAGTGEYFEVMRLEKKVARTDEFRRYLEEVGREVLEPIDYLFTKPNPSRSQMRRLGQGCTAAGQESEASS